MEGVLNLLEESALNPNKTLNLRLTALQITLIAQFPQITMRYLHLTLSLLLAYLSTLHASQTPRPNFLLIVVDDMGYSDISPFGSEIDTPAIDSIARKGIKFTNFYAGPSCSATRSMLLSGNDNHVVGLGNMYERLTPNQKGKPGYEGHLNNRSVTLATVLKDAGYHTYMAGKWHLGHAPEQDPSKRGFDKSYTLLQGGASHFDDEWMMYASYTPIYREDGVRTHVPSGFYSTEFYANKIMEYIGQQDDEDPFFAYLAFTAPHDPLHVPDEWLDRFADKYNEGYDAIREERLARMKELNIVPKETELSTWINGIPKWHELSKQQQREESRCMEIYASMIDNIDHHIGRVLDFLKESGNADNTVVVFMSDNGANGFPMHMYPGTDEAWVERNSDNRFENWGKRGSRIAPGPGWAQASSTPFRLYKHFLAEGGIRSPMIISGPEISAKNETTDNIAHVMDITPTFIELAGATYPSTHNGAPVEQPIGKSMVSFLSNQSAETYAEDDMLGWEYNDFKAVRMGQYKATWTGHPFGPAAWQLFDMSIDPGETTDLSDELPNIKQRLLSAYDDFAQTVGVIPLEATSN